jgi:hypothetical protein
VRGTTRHSILITMLGFQELRAHRNFLLEETPTTRTSLESSRQDEAI